MGNRILKTSDKTYHGRILTISQIFRKIICYDMIITSWQWVIVSDLEKIVWVSHYLKFILPSKSWKFIIVWICHASHHLTFMSSFYKSNTFNSKMFLTTDWLIKLSFEQNNWQEKRTHYRTTLFIETRGLEVTCKTNIWEYSNSNEKTWLYKWLLSRQVSNWKESCLIPPHEELLIQVQIVHNNWYN